MFIKIKPRLSAGWLVLDEEFSVVECCFLAPIIRNPVLEELCKRLLRMEVDTGRYLNEIYKDELNSSVGLSYA